MQFFVTGTKIKRFFTFFHAIRVQLHIIADRYTIWMLLLTRTAVLLTGQSDLFVALTRHAVVSQKNRTLEFDYNFGYYAPIFKILLKF